MCCIFTCCGWMIDLIQRLWTFTMACCISSAVCCALVTASMSGIALGYNYSLAEYIDLKETNVSVYLKRGVFDDEIADDMDWRRSGHMPVQGHLKDTNLATGGLEGPEEMPLRSGRRLDDSLMISDDQHKFEGSLMRLTARPPEASFSPTPEPVTSDSQMAEIMNKYPMGSMEQIKAIQGLMNMRRSGQRQTVLPSTESGESYDLSGRRVMPIGGSSMLPIDYAPIISDTYKRLNPARFAVPDTSINDPANWFLPKHLIPDSYRRTMDMVDYENLPSSRITVPQPFRIYTEIQRPTIPIAERPTPTHSAKPKEISYVQDSAAPGPSLEQLKNKLLMEKMDFPRQYKEKLKEPSSGNEFKTEDEYEDEANKGLPIRKKRNKRMVVKEDSYSSSHQTIYDTRTKNHNKDLSETNDIKTTSSVFISKLNSSSNKNIAYESSTSILNVSSVFPPRAEESSLIYKIISRFVSLQ